jgi:hypothetical protein
MTSDTSPYPQAPPPAAAARGWSGSDLVVGGALVVLLIALFLPWFSGTAQLFQATALVGGANGPQAHGYLWVVFVLAIVALIVLVARDAIGRLPGNLPSSEQMLVGATGLALVLTLLGLLQQPSSGAGVSVSWSYGGFVALLAALVAFFAASGTAARLAQARLRRPGTSA